MNEELKPILDALAEIAKRLADVEERISNNAIGKKSIWEMNKVMEAKMKLAQNLERKSFLDVAGGGHWKNDKDRKEFCALSKEISELNRQIAGI